MEWLCNVFSRSLFLSSCRWFLPPAARVEPVTIVALPEARPSSAGTRAIGIRLTGNKRLVLPRRLHRAPERVANGARFFDGDVPREKALDLRLVDRPHFFPHGEPRAGDDAVVAAAVVRRVLAHEEPGVFQPVGEASEVAPREHDAARELVHAQPPALGPLQFPE